MDRIRIQRELQCRCSGDSGSVMGNSIEGSSAADEGQRPEISSAADEGQRPEISSAKDASKAGQHATCILLEHFPR